MRHRDGSKGQSSIRSSSIDGSDRKKLIVASGFEYFKALLKYCVVFWKFVEGGFNYVKPGGIKTIVGRSSPHKKSAQGSFADSIRNCQAHGYKNQGVEANGHAKQRGGADGIPKWSFSNVHHEPGIYGHVLLPAFTAGQVTNHTGKPGVSISFFNQAHQVKDRVSFDDVTIPDTTYQLMDYDHPKKEDTFYMSMRESFILSLSGTYKFGLATYRIGDLFINDELIIDNSTTQTLGGMFLVKDPQRSGQPMKWWQALFGELERSILLP